MKLTKSKQFLADAIHASGKGWPDVAKWAAQDKDGEVYYFSSKPTIGKGSEVWSHRGCIGEGEFNAAKNPNWHQTVLSREEYFSAYPAELVAEIVADADGWIEWNGGERPVDDDAMVEVKLRNPPLKNLKRVRKACEFDWRFDGIDDGEIISYRLHKPEFNPEFCKSVTRSIPEPDAKPTIEQLAADYRNAKDYAELKQQEADDSKEAADAKLVLLVDAGKAHGLDVSPISATQMKVPLDTYNGRGW